MKKFSLKKICQYYSFSKYLLLGLFVLLFGLGGKFGVANAAANYAELTITSYTITIPSYTNGSILICQGGNTYDGGTMTSANPNAWTVNYVLNPTVGSHTVNAKQCILVDNLNSTSPLVQVNLLSDYMDYSWTVIFNTTGTTVDNEIVGIYYQHNVGFSQLSSSNSTWLTNVNLDNYNGQNSNTFHRFVDNNLSAPFIISGGSYQIGGGGTDSFTALELNTNVVPPITPPTVYDPQQVEGLYFRFNSLFNYCRVDMSCSIGYTFDQNIFGANATGTLLYYSTSTSTPQNLGTIQLNTEKELGIFGRGQIIATSLASSTAFSYYQIVPHSDIFNQDYATTSAAVWFIDAAAYTRIYEDPWNENNAGSSTSNLLGLNTRLMACNEEQWANDNIIQKVACSTRKWLLDVGITPMQGAMDKIAGLKQTIMGMFPFNLMSGIQNSWKNSTELLNYLTVTPCYAEDFSTSTGAYTGDFSFTAADLFGDKTGSTTISLISKNSMESLLGADGFNWFNIVCRILLWLAFFAYCWDLITNRLHKEITN
jgi:hypothetical protein